MPVVAQDATSLKWWPSASNQWASLLGGRLTALPVPNMSYGWQDLSTPLTDDFGVDAMTVSGGALASTVSGYARKAWQTADGTGNSVLTGGSYGGGQSTMMLALVDILATTTVQRTLVYHNQSWIDVQTSTGKLITIANSGGNNVSANAYAGVGIFPLVLRNNITAPFVRANTPLEQVNCGVTAAGANRFYYGGVINQTIGSQVAGSAHWLNANAEYTDAMVAMLIDSINNGPAITSIAISPTTATLSPLATQALAATSTRFDGSTLVNTSAVTWATSNAAVATVSSSGVVTAVAAGICNITCTFTSLGASTATSNTSVITVTGAVTLSSIAVTPATPALLLSGTQQMVATGTYSDASHADLTATAVWSIGSPHNLAVSAHGLVTALDDGTSTITATVGAISGSTTATVTIPTANKYTSMLMSLLPPGKVWRLIGGTVLFNLLAGCADELGRLDARTSDLLRENIPSTAVELLPQYESELAIVPGASDTNAQRQARIVARLVARQGYRPADFRTALASLLAQLPANVVVLERTAAFAASVGDVREIFRFFIYRNPATYPLTAAAMAAAVGYGTWSAGWLLDDAASPLAATFGAPNLALVGGTPIYQAQGPQSASDKGIGFVAAAGTNFSGGNVFNVSATSDLVFAWVGYHSAVPAASRTIIGKGTGSTPTYYVLVDSAGNLQAHANDGTTNYSAGVSVPIGKWYVGMMVIDRGATALRVATIGIDGTGAQLSTATTVPANIFASAGNFLFGASAGLDAVENATIAAMFIGQAVGAAAGMSANLATAVANLAGALRALALPYFLASAQALVNQIKPSHTVGTMIESINFLCDDPYSLCDRDLLGA